jgi:hypothetical protein
MERTCKKCGETKPIEEFSIGRDCKDGYRYTCKICSNKSHLKPLSQKIIDRIDLFRQGIKACCICKEIKPLYDFYPREVTADGLESNCKKCSNKISQKYKKNNKEKIKIKAKEWELRNEYRIVGYRKRSYFKNFERHQFQGKKYREEHQEEVKEYLYKYNQKKRKENDRNYIDKRVANTKKARKRCVDSYVIQCLTNVGIPKEVIKNNHMLLEAKREQLKLIHLIKQQNENSNRP